MFFSLTLAIIAKCIYVYPGHKALWVITVFYDPFFFLLNSLFGRRDGEKCVEINFGIKAEEAARLILKMTEPF